MVKYFGSRLKTCLRLCSLTRKRDKRAYSNGGVDRRILGEHLHGDSEKERRGPLLDSKVESDTLVAHGMGG